MEAMVSSITKAGPKLGYSLEVPEDWQRLPLPEEEPVFEDAGEFITLAVYQAWWAPVVCSVAVRPASGRAGAAEWLKYLCRDCEVIDGEASSVGEAEGARCLLLEKTAVGLMVRRLSVLLKDDLLYKVSAVAPAPIWEVMGSRFERIVSSFKPE